MKTFLFQGDSITDVGRSRDNDSMRGMGYPLLVSAELGCTYPNEYTFINRGISGNTVVDLYARLKRDILNLKPDYMTILIGVNDAWHGIDSDGGVNEKRFEKVYALLIEEIKEELPDIKIVILEPFVLNTGSAAAIWDSFRPEVEKRAAAAKRIAAKYDLPFIELQHDFDELVKVAPAEYWLGDGVHPTACGHEVIAKKVIKMFDKIK